MEGGAHVSDCSARLAEELLHRTPSRDRADEATRAEDRETKKRLSAGGSEHRGMMGCSEASKSE